MKIAVVSSSLNPSSRSRLMALAVKVKLDAMEGIEVDWIDLQELELPLCDGGSTYGHPNVIELNARLEAADAYVLASPVYNFDFNAALKNLVEFAGRKMENKLVGLIGAAGGAMSYMSPMALASSLMLDFRTLILPRFVYATPQDWEGDALRAPIGDRITQFVEDLTRIGFKLAG